MNKVFQGKTFSILQWEQKLYDGTTAIFERAKRTDGVRVIGVLPDKKILLVVDEQPDREGILGMAGGQMDEGEEREESAKREFFEETGYTVGELIYITSQTFPGRLMFALHYFVGRDLKKVNEPQQSPGERISLRTYTFEEFIALGQNEELLDLRLRIMLLEAQLDPKKKEALYKLLYE
jgi:ADP-ribose pyrophosphatase